MGRKALECLATFLLLDLFICHGMIIKETEDGWLNQKPLIRKMRGNGRRRLETRTSQREVTTPLATVPVVNPTKPGIQIPFASPTGAASTPSNLSAPVSGANPAPLMGSPASSSGQSWCVASRTASQTALQVALDYACGYGGADCSTIQPGRTCYSPDSVQDHASYAFNSYYQKNPIPTSCDFGGNAILTNVDPSSTSCKYPSTSMASSLLNTSNQSSGSRVFGSSPPQSSAAALRLVETLRIILCVAMAVLTVSHL